MVFPFRHWRSAHVAFLTLCFICEAVLFIYERSSAYIGLGAFAYALILWLMTRAFIPLDRESEHVAFRTTAKGWRLLARVVVVAATLTVVAFGVVWHSAAGPALQRVGALVGFPNDTAVPNFIVYVLIPAALLFALGAKPIELGLTAWRKGGWYALLAAFVLPTVLIVIWFSKGHATIGLLAFTLARNFLSNGFSEEFLMRGVTLSHLRAFLSKEWAVVLQAVLFGLLHLGGTIGDEHGKWTLAIANVVALNAPMGYFLALIALRARSVVLPGLIHMTLDTMRNLAFS